MDKAKKVRTGEELNWRNLDFYLKSVLPELRGEMKVAQFYGGHANLTYLIKFAKTELVLRRPPFGKIAPGAHDMKREFRVLSKLYKQIPQAPRAFHYCENEEIIGARFVVLERRKGTVVRYKVPECFLSFENVEMRLTMALVKAMANLHKVDVNKANLTKLGRPVGFVQRQLDGWAKRWELSKTNDNPIMDKVYEILNTVVPSPQFVSIIHNDLKFDNCQFQSINPDEVTSIFDWDMCTLGDPLIDCGTALSYWPDHRIDHIEGLPVRLKGNFPKKEFIIEKYSELTGFNMKNIAWYEAFAYWKNAVVGQQLYKRFIEGETTDARMRMFGKSAKVNGEMALEIIGG